VELSKADHPTLTQHKPPRRSASTELASSVQRGGVCVSLLPPMWGAVSQLPLLSVPLTQLTDFFYFNGTLSFLGRQAGSQSYSYCVMRWAIHSFLHFLRPGRPCLLLLVGDRLTPPQQHGTEGAA